jgi:hypothetical protein
VIVTFAKGEPTAMAIRQLPVVGRPTNPPAPLRKIAIEEHFIDPTQVHPNYGDSFSGDFDQEGSSYAGFNPEFADVVSARLHDLRDGRIEEMDAAGIDVAILSHTIGGVEGIPDPAVAVSTARRVNDFLAAEIASSGGRFADFATVALQDVGAAVKELTRAVTDLGFCGAMVNGYSNLGTEKLTSTRTGSSRSGPRWKSSGCRSTCIRGCPRGPCRTRSTAGTRNW